jgi:hypothetical protein
MSERNDESIERVMTALRTAEAREGLEARMMAAVHERATRPEQRPVAVGWWWGAGLTGIAALVLVAALHRTTPNTPPPDNSRVEARKITPPGTIVAALVEPKAATPRLKHARLQATVAPHVESFPAPAEPLTEQEKLLQRVARRGDKEDFALLNPETVELAMARDEADFDNFLLTARKKPNP